MFVDVKVYGEIASRSVLYQVFATTWSVACQAPLSMGFSRQEYWSGKPFPSSEDLPDSGSKPRSLALPANSLPSQSESESEVAQLCPTLCDSVDCSPPGSSVHGILQARILEWVAISFSRGSSQPRDQTRVSCIVGGCFIL